MGSMAMPRPFRHVTSLPSAPVSRVMSLLQRRHPINKRRNLFCRRRKHFCGFPRISVALPSLLSVGCRPHRSRVRWERRISGRRNRGCRRAGLLLQLLLLWPIDVSHAEAVDGVARDPFSFAARLYQLGQALGGSSSTHPSVIVVVATPIVVVAQCPRRHSPSPKESEAVRCGVCPALAERGDQPRGPSTTTATTAKAAATTARLHFGGHLVHEHDGKRVLVGELVELLRHGAQKPRALAKVDGRGAVAEVESNGVHHHQADWGEGFKTQTK